MQHSLPPIPQKARNGWGTAFQNFWAGSIIPAKGWGTIRFSPPKPTGIIPSACGLFGVEGKILA
jgi:hypothetical protein